MLGSPQACSLRLPLAGTLFIARLSGKGVLVLVQAYVSLLTFDEMAASAEPRELPLTLYEAVLTLDSSLIVPDRTLACWARLWADKRGNYQLAYVPVSRCRCSEQHKRRAMPALACCRHASPAGMLAHCCPACIAGTHLTIIVACRPTKATAETSAGPRLQVSRQAAAALRSMHAGLIDAHERASITACDSTC